MTMSGGGDGIGFFTERPCPRCGASGALQTMSVKRHYVPRVTAWRRGDDNMATAMQCRECGWVGRPVDVLRGGRPRARTWIEESGGERIICVSFPRMPRRSVREALREAGFRWQPDTKRWEAPARPETEQAANEAVAAASKRGAKG